MNKYIAELIGTLVLVLFGCGSAAIAGETLGTLGIAFAFGLSIVAMAFVIGNVSGCHVNPAVSLGMLIDGRMDIKDFVGYVISQCIGAIIGIAILAFIINSSATLGGVAATGLGANGFGSASSVGLNMIGALVVEIILTFVFVFTILGVTENVKTGPYAGLIIGLTLTFVHIMGIPLTGTSVNPARSLAPALLLGGTALNQVWVFIVAPLVGAAIAAFVYKFIAKEANTN
ncbi:MAG: MIP family channel protein [Methanosphaera stadtmanae]|jgi:aquaporin Z|nr:MIP family channel protein [Methanosphaera stadtmanae]